MFVLSRGAAFLLFFSLAAIFSAFPSLAQESPGVVINEIAWMGTESSSNDEWIELYNSDDAPVSLDNWTLTSLTGSLKINLKGMIPSKGFYLLERSDDDTIPSLMADFVYTGALKNTGEIIELRNSLVNPIDLIDCSAGWVAGNNNTKQTMERVAGAWQDSKEPGGTPKGENSSLGEITEKKEATAKYPSGIMINEMLPSPEGPDSENEWIELFNDGGTEADLSAWKISDSLGSTKEYSFLQGTAIPSKGFLLLKRPETGIVLNNEGDGLKLFNPAGETVDSVEYGKAATGESFIRTGTSWSWSALPTPKAENKAVARTKESSPKQGEKETASSSPLAEKALAAANYPTRNFNGPKERMNASVLLSALTISVFSGIVILTLKKKVKQLN